MSKQNSHSAEMASRAAMLHSMDDIGIGTRSGANLFSAEDSSSQEGQQKLGDGDRAMASGVGTGGFGMLTRQTGGLNSMFNNSMDVMIPKAVMPTFVDAFEGNMAQGNINTKMIDDLNGSGVTSLESVHSEMQLKIQTPMSPSQGNEGQSM